MAAPITSLGFVPGQNILPSRFSDAEIQAAELFVSQYLTDLFPTMDFVKGSVLYNMVVRPTAMIYLICRSGWDTLRITQSLAAVIKNPELASDEIVNAILSNFQITRRIGSLSTGRVKMVFSKETTQTISTSVVFKTSEGLEFKPSSTFRIISEPKDPMDLKLVNSGVGQYYAIVPVVASSRGADYQIRDGIPLFTSLSSSFFVAASSFGNFVGGSEDETNEALIARLPEAMAVKNLSSRLSISSTLKSAFSDILDVSTQGASSPVMARNSHNLFGVKMGGFADIYIKSASGILNGQVSLAASLVEIVGTTKAVYLVTVGKDLFPGHYFINSVKSSAESISSYFIQSQVKSLDATDGWGNIIPESEEGAYSVYQESAVYFEIDYDSSLGTSPGDQFESSITVAVEVSYVQGIGDIQALVSDREEGIILADYLVKAAVPCFITLPTITVEASSYSKAVEVRRAIYNYITGLSIGDQLRLDEMIVKIKSVGEVKSVKLPISIRGTIFCPKGGTLDISSNGDLSVPYRPDLLVVAQNTTFFIELSDINVAVILS
jgi:hypothetical protein